MIVNKYICKEKKESKCKISFLLLFIGSWSIYLCRKNALFNVRREACDISRNEILILCVTLELKKKDPYSSVNTKFLPYPKLSGFSQS